MESEMERAMKREGDEERGRKTQQPKKQWENHRLQFSWKAAQKGAEGYSKVPVILLARAVAWARAALFL